MFASLRLRLGLIFMGFLLLVSGSAAATFYIANTQSTDALVINLAGRQRMLVQRMGMLAITEPDSTELQQAIQTFTLTLQALHDGGEISGPDGENVWIPEAPDDDMHAMLDEVDAAWTSFLPLIRDPSRTSPAEISAASASLVERMDRAVLEFQGRARWKVTDLLSVQVFFLAAALVLLALGYTLARQGIFQPLDILGAASVQIGNGELDQPVQYTGQDEIGQLAITFDGMRTALATARDHLETRVVQRTQELAAAFEFSQEIVTSRDLDRLLQSVTDRARQLLDADRATLCLISPEGQVLTHSSLRDSLEQVQTTTTPRSPLTDEKKDLDSHIISMCQGCDAPLQASGAFLSHTLQIGGVVQGSLCLERKRSDDFDIDKQQALVLLANSAAIAIANARLAQAEQEQARQAAALAERQRLAVDLHDNLAQTLSFIRLKIESAQDKLEHDNIHLVADLERAHAEIDRAYCQVRAALQDLHEPAILVPPTSDLASRIAILATEFQNQHKLQVFLNFNIPPEFHISRLVQDQSVHIVREALTNAYRHAHASEIRIGMAVTGYTAQENTDDGPGLEISIQDNGIGFNPAETLDAAATSHLGLKIMQTRAERTGGKLEILSGAGAGRIKGTLVRVSFPLSSRPGLLAAQKNSQGQAGQFVPAAAGEDIETEQL